MNSPKENTVLSILRGVDIFGETSDRALIEIGKALTAVELKANETIIVKGEKGHAMYIIVNGKVKVHDGDHVFTYLKAGSCFGEYSLIDEEVRSASITGVEPTRLFRLDQETFYQLLTSEPNFAKEVLKVLIGRLRQLDVIQEQLATSNEKIMQQKEEIEIKNHELEELNDEKSHLMSIVAHDLRNPLTSSVSIANSLKSEMEESRPDLTEYTDSLVNSLWRMNEMITRILDARAVESKKTVMDIKPINLAEILADVHKQFISVAAQKDITLHLEVTSAVANLDEGYTRQIFENLVSNAIKFSSPNKEIKIKLTEDGNELLAEVIDQGPGLDDDDKQKLFGKFQKLSARPTGGENSIGIGLSIVKKYVEEMEGEIHCESELGNGATFKVKFQKTQ